MSPLALKRLTKYLTTGVSKLVDDLRQTQIMKTIIINLHKSLTVTEY